MFKIYQKPINPTIVGAYRQLTAPALDGDDVVQIRLCLPATVDDDGTPRSFLAAGYWIVRGPRGTIERVHTLLASVFGESR